MAITDDRTHADHTENTELFDQRRELTAAVDQLTTSDHADVSARRRLRMLRRRIDEVTSTIVSQNMGLVRSYTRRFTSGGSGVHRSEFEAAGLLGLMRAVHTYDPASGTFGQWAFQPIRREVLRAVRDADHQSLSLGDFEKRPAILAADRRLRGIGADYAPSIEEVAALAGVTVSQARRVLAPPSLQSMDGPLSPGSTTFLSDSIASTEPDPESEVLAEATWDALSAHGLSSLSAREMHVIVGRFGLDGEAIRTLREIGESLGVSREAVRQIESKALRSLQNPLVTDWLCEVSHRSVAS